MRNPIEKSLRFLVLFIWTCHRGNRRTTFLEVRESGPESGIRIQRNKSLYSVPIVMYMLIFIGEQCEHGYFCGFNLTPSSVLYLYLFIFHSFVPPSHYIVGHNSERSTLFIFHVNPSQNQQFSNRSFMSIVFVMVRLSVVGSATSFKPQNGASNLSQRLMRTAD